jgi:hypothetical protein
VYDYAAEKINPAQVLPNMEQSRRHFPVFSLGKAK